MDYYILTPFLFVLRILEVFSQLSFILIISNTTFSAKKFFGGSILLAIVFELIKVFIPQYFTALTSTILFDLMLIFIIKINYKKAIVSHLITAITVAIIDCIVCTTIVKLCGLKSFEVFSQSDMLMAIAKIFIAIITFFIAQILNKYKSKSNFENAKNNTELTTLIFTFFLLIPNLIMILYYHDQKTLPLAIIIINIVAIIATFFINIFNTRRGIKLVQTEEALISEKIYSKTQHQLVDSLRTFKHDYNNTLQTIHGYIFTQDMDGLKIFFEQILAESKTITALDKLSPELFRNPSLFGLVTAKFEYARSKDVTMNLEIYADLNNIDMKTYDFTRILGILLDNAIEAAAGSEKKIVNFYVVERNNKITIDLSNSFSDTGLKIEDINKKGVSSKGENRGLGLYKVEEILSRYPKVIHDKPTISNGMFLQKLIINKVKLPIS